VGLLTLLLCEGMQKDKRKPTARRPACFAAGGKGEKKKGEKGRGNPESLTMEVSLKFYKKKPRGKLESFLL